MTKKSKSSDAQWTDIYTQLQEDKVEFFLNTHLEPTVLIPDGHLGSEPPKDSEGGMPVFVGGDSNLHQHPKSKARPSDPGSAGLWC